MLDVAADVSDAEWVKTEANDQWMGMTDDEAESTKSEDGECVEPDESVVDSRADSSAGFAEIMDPVQTDLERKITMQRSSLKRRVKSIDEMRLKLQRCILVRVPVIVDSLILLFAGFRWSKTYISILPNLLLLS